jgi:hypothetical protein
MLREIGLPMLILMVLTIAVGLLALTQAEFGPLVSDSIGVTAETALVWGEDADLAVEDHAAADEDAAGEAATAEATEEASD